MEASAPNGPPQFEVKREGDVVVLTFTDRKILTDEQVQLIGQQLFSLVEQGCSRIVINFAPVQFYSSAGFGKLIVLRKRLTEVNGKLVLCGINSGIYETFAITRLNRVFNILDTEEAAIRECLQPS